MLETGSILRGWRSACFYTSLQIRSHWFLSFESIVHKCHFWRSLCQYVCQRLLVTCTTLFKLLVIMNFYVNEFGPSIIYRVFGRFIQRLIAIQNCRFWLLGIDFMKRLLYSNRWMRNLRPRSNFRALITTYFSTVQYQSNATNMFSCY